MLTEGRRIRKENDGLQRHREASQGRGGGAIKSSYQKGIHPTRRQRLIGLEEGKNGPTKWCRNLLFAIVAA